MPFWDVLPGCPMRPLVILTEVVEKDKRPTKPDALSEAHNLTGLTEEIWTMMELCWLRNPTHRPSASELAAFPPFLDIVDDRPRA